MTITELNDITFSQWLISLWPVWLIVIGVLAGIVSKFLQP